MKKEEKKRGRKKESKTKPEIEGEKKAKWEK